MARIPITRGLSRTESWNFSADNGDDEIQSLLHGGKDVRFRGKHCDGDGEEDGFEQNERGKEVKCSTSSGIESYQSRSKSRKKSTYYMKRRFKPPRQVYIPSPVTTRKNARPAQSDETKLTLRQTDAGKLSKRRSGDVVIDIPTDEKTLSADGNRDSKTERFWSVVLCLLVVCTGLTLGISVNLNTDSDATEIKPKVFRFYVVVLISVFILCFLWQMCKARKDVRRNWSNVTFQPLIPVHLRNGLILFAVCSYACQGASIVDFIKCSRNVTGLDKSYVVYHIMELIFVFIQIYVFYTLSLKRDKNVWFGIYLIMFTLAINMTIWAGYFLAGITNQPDLKNVTWLRQDYYGAEIDLCRYNNTGNKSREFHHFILAISPYTYTFTMEYCLLAIALLLHLRQEIGTPRGDLTATNKKWSVWRFGFVLGLLTLPVTEGIAVAAMTEFQISYAKLYYFYGMQLVVSLLLLASGIIGIMKFKTSSIRDKRPLKIDIILLCSSSVGFVVIDVFTIFGSIGEISKSSKMRRLFGEDSSPIYLLLGFQSVCELAGIISLTSFMLLSYFHRFQFNPGSIKAATYIRQICSFCIVVNMGQWISQTYTFRSKYEFDLAGEKYFGDATWFVVTQIFTPMCIFYHFHSAVSLTEIIAQCTTTERDNPVNAVVPSPRSQKTAERSNAEKDDRTEKSQLN